MKENSNVGLAFIQIGNTYIYLDDCNRHSLITFGLDTGYSCTSNVYVEDLLKALKKYHDDNFISLDEAIARMSLPEKLQAKW